MARIPAIGLQDFSDIIEKNCFYVDKTNFIKEWWERNDDVTLITRPRRFGKTLMMSTVEYFFSVKHEGRGDLFEGLSVWEDEKYRDLQGTYPVIFLSFADAGADSYEEIYAYMLDLIRDLYRINAFLLDSEKFSRYDCEKFDSIARGTADSASIIRSLDFLSEMLFRYYGKKVIILIDEYDTPMNTAYVSGFWEQLVKLFRDFFTNALKTNQYLERAILTGITRISKESFFSKLNNPEIVSVTSDKYAVSFGFTQEEVFLALQEFGLEHTMDEVRRWYDGFQFGPRCGIYNPWSLIHYLGKRKLGPYWVNSGSNDLVSVLVRKGDNSIKTIMEDLLHGKSFRTEINEQLVFDRLEKSKTAIWSLLLASGYVKALSVDGKTYELALTNHEVDVAFREMVDGWFEQNEDDYHGFVKALLRGDLEEMNDYMNTVVVGVISSFDSGTKPAEKVPERLHSVKATAKGLTEPNPSACFYHGLVLGLIVSLEGRYVVTSNRESGKGRCDVMLEPLHAEDDGMILEFKVHDPKKESSLQDTAQAALRQIADKGYVSELAKKVPKNRIRVYGFAFKGKQVLIL